MSNNTLRVDVYSLERREAGANCRKVETVVGAVEEVDLGHQRTCRKGEVCFVEVVCGDIEYPESVGRKEIRPRFMVDLTACSQDLAGQSDSDILDVVAHSIVQRLVDPSFAVHSDQDWISDCKEKGIDP